MVEGCTFRLSETPAPPGAQTPTYVLVHGIGMSHRSLARLHDLLAVSARVVSVDLPGFGGLPKPPHDLDVAQMGRLLAAVLASLGEGPLVLLGHSMGAQWVIEAAGYGPLDIGAVVLIGPVVDERHQTLTAQSRALGLDTLLEPPLVNALVFVDYLRCGIVWYLKQARHMVAYSTEQGVRELRMPVLVIRGGADPVAGLGWCRRLRDAARTGRLVEIPRRHHVAPFTAARAVADAILIHTTDAWPGLDRARVAAHRRSTPSRR